MINLVISGGQSGADLAGNVWARGVGLATDIRTFAGFKPQNKEDLGLYQSFPRSEVFNPGRGYVQALRDRTQHNVLYADATLIFTQLPLELTKGSKLTARLAAANHRPHRVVTAKALFLPDAVDQVLDFWVRHPHVKILNVAGQREIHRETVVKILTQAWGLYKELR